MKARLLLISLFLSVQVFGQKKYLADRYFDEFSYKKAAEVYKEMVQEGDTTKHVLKQLADSYYYNTNTKDAEIWYGKLIKKYKKYVAAEYIFRYANALKSNGKYEESDKMMKEFLRVKPNDSRYQELAKRPDYVSVFSDTIYQKKKKETINVHNVSLNTKYSDFGGFLKGDKFYYASSAPRKEGSNKIYRWNEQPYLDMYVATIKEQNLDGGTDQEKIMEVVDPEIFGEPIQSKYHEANAVVTKDGLTMYFTRVNFNGKKLGKNDEREVFLKIYKAHLVNGKWDNVEELPFNNDDYSCGHPALSPDEKTLYFVSDMPGSLGATDIYKVPLRGKNQYGKVESLGKAVNTEGREAFPFMTKDSVLYFSSDGHLGLGALDIFETKLTKDNTFSEVKNIQAPFNSKRDDFGFTVNKEKNKGFFSSNRKGGKGDDDIYSFVVASCTQTLEGTITNLRTGEPIAGALVTILDANGEKVADLVTKEDGKYEFKEANCGSSYTVKASKETYAPNKKDVNTSGKNNLKNTADIPLKSLLCSQTIFGIVTEKRTGKILAGATVKLIDASGKVLEEVKSAKDGSYSFSAVPCKTSIRVVGEMFDHKPDKKSLFTTTEDGKQNEIDLQLAALIVGNQIVISPIFFDYNKYNIREDAAYELENIVTVMKNHPEMIIKIEAHTDSRGKKAYNKLLSDKRAKSTRDYIFSRGIANERIKSAIGYGEEQLLNRCSDGVPCSKEEHQENRRSYFYILSGAKDVKVDGQKNKS